MRRRLLLIFLALCAGMIALVATLPLWLGAAARMAGPSRGLTFARYERLGYARFALHQAEFKRFGVRVTVARAEADTPVLWLWRHVTGHSAPIVAGAWRVDVRPAAPAGAPRGPGGPRGWMPLRALLQRIATELDRWLPVASTGAGSVHWPGGEVAVASAQWSKRTLDAKGVAYRALHADAILAFGASDDLRLSGRTTDGAVTAKLENVGADVRGDVALWEQPATLTARFDPQGWLPAEGVLQAKSWRLGGDRLKLGTLYSAVQGSALIEWRAGHFAADITAAGEPLPGKPVPPLEIALQGKGDLESFTIDALRAALPGVTAHLSESVTVERSGSVRGRGARFALQADLAKVPWFSAAGSVNGEARFVSSLAAAPIVEFSLEARGVKAQDVALSAVTTRGRLEWPRVQITEGILVGGEGERLAGHGGWDFRAGELLDAVLEGEIRRTSLARWLPRQPDFEAVTLSAHASGPVAAMLHQGQARAASVLVPGIRPLAVELAWAGRGAAVTRFEAVARAGASMLRTTGALDASALELTGLEFTQGENPRLRLTAPAKLTWRPGLHLEPLKLAGPEGDLSAAFAAGETGRMELSAHRIDSKWFSDFLTVSVPPATLTLLAAVGTWDRGPMTFSLTAGAGIEIAEGRVAAVNVAARGDGDGLRIEALRAMEASTAVVNATGRLPITLTPGAAQRVHIDPQGALVLDAAVAPNSAFWRELANLSGVALEEPDAAAHLTGTWEKPEGNVSVRAARVALDPKRVTRPLPTMEALDLRVSGDRSAVKLETFTAKVEGQAVRAQGQLPVPGGDWGRLLREPFAAARRGADVRLEIPDAEVAAFTRFLPAVLAPKGRFEVDVHYKPGGLEGFVRVRDAASRPLGPLGVLQEINAELALSGRKLVLRGVTAKSGGQPVTLTGTVELPEKGGPQFDLALRGDNLPFIRQTGLLVRGDLDLKLQTPSGAQPRLSGNVRLRDSLFLSDVRSFLPKGGAGPSRRPPYFAIETPPVNAWTLAVDVAGAKFLRLRTPVFAGVASAHFRLGGTLGEPRAIGEITIDEGSVRMPFASFAVTQGAVRLTEAEPFEPAVYVRGNGRRYGYDLTMEIQGTASQPSVLFTSSPALDSEQVLLMVMTGAAPSNEVTKSATQRVANIGYFLGQSLLGSLGSEAADADRLSFATGEKVSRQGKETYDIEYKLSDRWTLTGEYNEFDEYNAGVKWRVFRGKSAAEKHDDAKK